MAYARKYDRAFLITIVFLVLFGFFELSSASLGLTARGDKNSYIILFKQMAIGGAGFFLFFLCSKIPYKKWKTFAIPIFIASFLLTLLVLENKFGLSSSHGGAKRWLNIGPFTLQPSEFLKLAFVIYLSSWLSRRQNEIGSFKTGVLPFLVMAGFVSAALILQPDFGTLGIILITAAILFFLAGAKWKHMALIFVLGPALVIGLAYGSSHFSCLKDFSHLKKRIDIFLNPSKDTQDSGYQLYQMKTAIGSGGIFGKGFGDGTSKFNFLPEPIGDSIFAVIGEEFGFIGTLFLSGLFVFLFLKCIRISIRAPDSFGRLLAAGLGIIIVIQAFINMYASVGLIPLTGVPLTFISQGGSALIFNLAEAGIIFNISNNC
ncbi:MAG: putative peptidoglycan glycosyltransferase FtsW [Candidatus Pacebacteria bacterium]|nr:putative peptidoglycan glycosyltransferase FtsW [Candidatus Paceibacterota bacterium]